MSKQDFSKPAKPANTQYLPLLKVGQTFLTYNEQRHSVQNVPPNIFDVWIRQYVDTILNVDTDAWDIFDRWQVINAVLGGGFLVLEGDELKRKKKLPIPEAKTTDTPALEANGG